MKLRNFHAALKECLSDIDPNSHPFVCDGSPFGRRIVIVGHNPATRLSEPFWSYWDDTTGFKKTKFLKHYCAQRGKLKGARQRIEKIAEAIGQENVLDTNIYVPATRTEAELSAKDKKTEVIRFLLPMFSPRIVWAHGWKAIKFFRKNCIGFERATSIPQPVSFGGVQFNIICSRHLSRIGIEDAIQIAKGLIRTLDGGGYP